MATRSPLATITVRPFEPDDVYVLIAEFVPLAGASIPTPVIVAVIDSPFPAVATSVALFWVITIDAAALALSSLDAITVSSVFNSLVVVDSPVVR